MRESRTHPRDPLDRASSRDRLLESYRKLQPQQSTHYAFNLPAIAIQVKHLSAFWIRKPLLVEEYFVKVLFVVDFCSQQCSFKPLVVFESILMHTA